jgi:hypothetical protein
VRQQQRREQQKLLQKQQQRKQHAAAEKRSKKRPEDFVDAFNKSSEDDDMSILKHDPREVRVQFNSIVLFNPFTASCENTMTLSVPGVPASCEKFPHSSQLNF